MSDDFRSHPAVSSWQTRGGDLLVDGVPLTRLADRVGTGTFYAYDRQRIADRVAHLRSALPETVHLHYAVKANPMPAVIQALAGLVDGFDVASAGEMVRVLDAGAAPQRISFAGPGKRPTELRQAMAAGITLHVESETELRRIADLAAQTGYACPVAIRVNPDFEVKGSGMKMGGGAQQFGVDADKVPALVGLAASSGLSVAGFHIFGGSQNLNARIILESQTKIADLALRLADETGLSLRHLNMGGGFGIPYFTKDVPLDLDAVGSNLEGLVTTLRAAHPEVEIIVELGRYLVGEAGIYVTRIVDRKVSRDTIFLVTEGGLNHHLAASGNFGQVLRRNYPVAIGNRMDGPSDQVVDIVGPLCTPLDLLAKQVVLPLAEIGDYVVIFQSGAYGPTASPSAFLGHGGAAEVLV